jgi:hypothetical protein
MTAELVIVNDDDEVVHLKDIWRKSWVQLARDMSKSYGESLALDDVRNQTLEEHGFRTWDWDPWSEHYIYCDFDGIRIASLKAATA